jgi:hypothetical protein
VYWALAQTAPPPLASLFPAGALVYLEAKDLGSLLADWNGSAEKRAWLTSTNYQAFSRSQLFLKLGDAQKEFAVAAGVPPDYALLGSVAGGNSGLAMYNIGKLEFLYITHLASTRAMNTALWKARGSYSTRKAGGVDYFVKEDKASQRVAAFAYAGDVLLLATKEELIAGALELLARQPRPAVVGEKWFTDAVQAAEPGATDLRLVYNMERLTPSFHFRSYWVQRNRPALREFAGGLADLERVSGELRERRVMLRTNPSAGPSSNETAVGQLLAVVPDDAGLYRAWLRPSGDQAERWIEEKLFAAVAPPGPQSKRAPEVAAASDAGTELDLESRIDESPLTDDRSALAFGALRERLSRMPLDAMLDVASTRVDADQVFVRSQSAIVLLAGDSWDGEAIRAALTSASGALWSNAGPGAGWRAGANGVRELDGLGKLVMAVDGRWLVLGHSAELVNAILARRNRAAGPGAAYAAGWRHARELPNFERMMRLIDFPQIHATPMEGGPTAAREPMFYSENIASLGRALQRMQSAAIVVHDIGPMLRESVTYRLSP